MKKIAIIAAILMVFGATSVFATGIGVQGGYNPATGAGGGLTFKLDTSPVVFAVNANINNGVIAIGGTGDVWLANPFLSKPVKWFYGIGLGAGARIGNGVTVTVGPRLVAGLNILVAKAWEFFIQAAYQPTLKIAVGDNVNINFDWVSVPVNAGFRFWF